MKTRPNISIEEIKKLSTITNQIVRIDKDIQIPIKAEMMVGILSDLVLLAEIEAKMNNPEFCNPINFLQTLKVNINNKRLSDKEFREFVSSSIEVVNPELFKT